MRNKNCFHGKVELYDKVLDSYKIEPLDVESGMIVLVEGIFLQRRALQGCFDMMIYVDVSEEIRLQRVLKRDSYIGNSMQIGKKYKTRYFPAEHYYVKTYTPA